MQEVIGNLENLPEELKASKNWFLTYKDKTQRNYKRPLNFIQWGNKENLVDFQEVKAKASSTSEKVMPAFAFINNVNYIGIDLDAHKNDFQTIEEFEAKKKFNEELIEKYFKGKPCYIEISASGDGYHILCKVDKPEVFTTFKTNLEVKSSNNISYVCMALQVVQAPAIMEAMDLTVMDFLKYTGNENKVNTSQNKQGEAFGGEPTINSPKEEDFVDKQSVLNYLEKLHSDKIEAPYKDTRLMTSSELIDFLKNRKDKYGAQFNELFNGIWLPYATDTPPSQSSADFKFFCLIYAWNKDKETIRSIYKESGLYREGEQENGTIKEQPHYFDFSYNKMVQLGVYHYYDNNTFTSNYNTTTSTKTSSNSTSSPKVSSSEAKVSQPEAPSEEETLEAIYNKCDLKEFIENFKTNKDRATRKYATGVESFDYISRNDKGEGGFDTGLNVIVAPSGFGKSLFMMQSAEYIARHNEDAIVLYFNLEMDAVRLCRNNLKRHLWQELNGYGDTDEEDFMQDYLRKHKNLFIMPNDFYKYEDIMKFTEYIQENKCKNVVVFIDYFQKLQSNNTKDFFQRRELLEKMLMDFKIYGNKKQASFIVASNMAKNQLGDLVDETSGKETGDILFSTDNFFGIDLDYKYTKEYNKLNSSCQGKPEASENLLRAKRCECKLMRFKNFKLRDGRSGGETLGKLVGKEKRFLTVNTCIPRDTKGMTIEDYEEITKDTVLGSIENTLEELLH